MALLKTLGTGQGFLKAGFLGFPKSGKTYTAVQLAIGTRALMKQTGPIAMFDTEGGSEYVHQIVKEKTGKELLGVRSRSFDDLLSVGRECVDSGVAVLVVDSITHVWKELCDAFLKKVNDGRSSKGLRPRYNLEFQDWNPLKGQWGKWADFYLNSPLHIIICGRAGFEYDFETNEETGKKELVKSGTKMKVESDFGFEPSLLVEMDRHKADGQLLHRATILGDRFGLIDSKVCDNPTFDFFKPHVSSLIPGAHAPVDTSVKSAVDIDEDGNSDWQREKKERTILCEEIQGVLLKYYPGQSAQEKQSKSDLIDEFFHTRSWTKVESANSSTLRAGLSGLRNKLEKVTSEVHDNIEDVTVQEVVTEPEPPKHRGRPPKQEATVSKEETVAQNGTDYIAMLKAEMSNRKTAELIAARRALQIQEMEIPRFTQEQAKSVLLWLEHSAEKGE